MDKLQLRTVQRVPRERFVRAVHGVAHKRMPKVRHVHADLMRSAGLQPKAQKRNAPVGLLHLIAGAALLAAVADLAGDGAALFDADGRVHNAAAVHLPAAQRIVGLVDLMRQRIGDVRTFRHRQKPARVAVKAVDRSKSEAWIKCGKKISQRIVTMLY